MARSTLYANSSVHKRLFINFLLDTGNSRVLIKRHTDTHFGLTNRLNYHVYGGYSIDKNRTVIFANYAYSILYWHGLFL